MRKSEKSGFLFLLIVTGSKCRTCGFLFGGHGEEAGKYLPPFGGGGNRQPPKALTSLPFKNIKEGSVAGWH